MISLIAKFTILEPVVLSLSLKSLIEKSDLEFVDSDLKILSGKFFYRSAESIVYSKHPIDT